MCSWGLRLKALTVDGGLTFPLWCRDVYSFYLRCERFLPFIPLCVVLSFGNPRKGLHPSLRSKRGERPTVGCRGKENPEGDKNGRGGPQKPPGDGTGRCRASPRTWEWGLVETDIGLALAGGPQQKPRTRACGHQLCHRRLRGECRTGLWVNRTQGTNIWWGRGLKSPFSCDLTLHWTA